MFYSLLGRAVWFGAKLFARRKLSHVSMRKPLLAGGGAVVALGVVAALLRARSTDGE